MGFLFFRFLFCIWGGAGYLLNTYDTCSVIEHLHGTIKQYGQYLFSLTNYALIRDTENFQYTSIIPLRVFPFRQIV